MLQDVHVKIKFRLVITKAAFNKKKNLFTRKLDLTFSKKLVKCCICRRKTLGTLKNRSGILYVVLEKHEADQLGRSCEK